MSDSSVHAADKKNKKRGSAGASGSGQALTNVFDTHGNDLLALHLQDARAQQEEGPELSMLEAAQQQAPGQAVDEEEELLALRQAGTEQEEEQQQGHADVDGAVQTAERGADAGHGDKDERAFATAHDEAQGDGEKLKKALLDGSGTTILVRYMDDAQSELDMPPMNPDAQRAVVDQIRRQVDERALANASDMDEVDEVMRQALRENALRAREEIILLMMRLMSSPQDMEAIGALPEKGDRAIQVIEYLAEFTAEIDDLHALAAYDHRDLMHDIPVISTEALEIKRYLSPLSLHFGGFAPILWQMICNELDRTSHGGRVDQAAEEEEADTSGMTNALMVVLNDMRMARFLEG